MYSSYGLVLKQNPLRCWHLQLIWRLIDIPRLRAFLQFMFSVFWARRWTGEFLSEKNDCWWIYKTLQKWEIWSIYIETDKHTRSIFWWLQRDNFFKSHSRLEPIHNDVEWFQIDQQSQSKAQMPNNSFIVSKGTQWSNTIHVALSCALNLKRINTEVCVQ